MLNLPRLDRGCHTTYVACRCFWRLMRSSRSTSSAVRGIVIGSGTGLPQIAGVLAVAAPSSALPLAAATERPGDEVLRVKRLTTGGHSNWTETSRVNFPTNNDYGRLGLRTFAARIAVLSQAFFLLAGSLIHKASPNRTGLESATFAMLMTWRTAAQQGHS